VHGAALHAVEVFTGLAALYFGANWLVGAATDVARRLGVSALLIGLTVVAVGTSLPELFVAVSAALEGHASVSLGNVVGANALNIGLILGAAAIVSPLQVNLRVLRWDVPIMLAATALLVCFAWSGTISRLQGAFLLAGMVGYLIVNVLLARHERRTQSASAFAGAIEARVPGGSWQLDVARGAAGMAALGAGAHFMISGALGFAALFGLSESVVALTLVSAGTTLPELVTALVAASRKQGDIAFGNIVGSNINNALTVMGSAAVIRPIETGDVGAPVMLGVLALSMLAVPVMWRGFVVTRWEGCLLVGAYGVFVAVAVRS
jgi:cation:H+ antiporter